MEKAKLFPAFSLADQTGKTAHLADYKDNWLVVFFYPKDNTPACTSEVAAFAEYEDKFKAAGAKIVGISGDSVSSHKKFAEKLGVDYQLLADPERTFTASLGLLVDKVMYGKPAKGVNRSTYLIDPAGKIVDTWHNVDVNGHAEAVFQTLTKLKSK